MKKSMIWLLAVGIGIVDAALLFAFEFVGIDVTAWLWNDLLHTDEHRWAVLPTAVVLGLVFTACFKLVRAKRVVSTESDLLAEIDQAPATMSAIGTTLLLGAVSLLAGASLGPEAALMTTSAAIGAYAAHRWRADSSKQLLVLASIGALLVAFISSIVLVLVPLLILFQGAKKQGKRLQLKPVAVVLVAGLASFRTIQLINSLTGHSNAASAPAMPSFEVHDFVVALVLGFVAGLLALVLNGLIAHFYKLATWLDGRTWPAKPWLLGAGFGLVLGILYLIGGQTVEFSGKIGTGLLVTSATEYGALALAGLVAVKLLTTAWSKGTGYIGGLVFPSIYIGTALGLLVGEMFGGLAGAGAMIGGIAGILTAAVGSPIMAAIFLIAALPVKLWPVAACAVVGTIAFDKLSKRMSNKRQTS